MPSLAVTGIGQVLTGDLGQPLRRDVEVILCADGKITYLGPLAGAPPELARAHQRIDAQGSTVAAGLIDSHCHVVLGDYTPRQKTVDFLASYVHGGITSVISPGEIHAPGRGHTARGAKALAITARTCFEGYRPGGMTVHAGAVVLEPTLAEPDFAELRDAGVFLAKFGFGGYDKPADGVEQVKLAQAHGIIVTCHSGGASIPGSKPITTDDLLLLQPDVCGHINGGPTSLDPDGIRRIVGETSMVLQLVQAGNLRSSLEIISMAIKNDALSRVVLGSDTPTGTGVMPLGVIKTVAELSSLSDLQAETVWALATGNSAAAWGLNSGRLTQGSDADLIVMDAPWGGLADDAVGALNRGDIPGISAVVTCGQVRALLSRNTPRPARLATAEPALPHLTADGH